MKRNFFTYVLIVMVIIGLAGCATQVKYGDAKAVETLTTDFGSTDLQMMAEKMVKSLLNSPIILNASKKQVLIFDRIRNLTRDHLETSLVSDMIRTQLIQSGLVYVATGSNEFNVALNQIKMGQSGLIDPTTAKTIGKKVGADYILMGSIKSIAKRRGSDEDVYFQFTMNLQNIENGLLEWSDFKEIRKSRE